MILTNLFKECFDKYDTKIFIETGTFEGDSIKRAIDIGFNKIFSVELNENRYCAAKERFYDFIQQNKVELFLGYSTLFLESICPNLNDKALFWIDAHGEGGGSPAFEELNLIKTSPRNDHIIIVDDIDVYYDHNKHQLEQKILEINEYYKFKYITTVFVDRVLVSYLENSYE